MKRRIFWAILLLLALGLAELVSRGALPALSEYRGMKYEPVDELSPKHRTLIRRFLDGKLGYIAFDPLLGWSIRRDGSYGPYRANSRSLRADREYALDPPPGIIRIASFGDSFTHCDDVRNDETWQAAMERADPRLEVLNFGVSGYGLDQAYLRYREEGIPFRPEIVLIGYMSENINRNVNTYRPFYFPGTGLPLAKPRFRLVEGRPVLVPCPMRSLGDYEELLRRPQEVTARLGADDYFCRRRYRSNRFDRSAAVRLALIAKGEIARRLLDDEIVVDGRYNEDSEAFRVTKGIFGEFRRASIENGSVPVIVLFPNLDDVIRFREDREKSYSALLDYFDEAGCRYVDLMDAFENADPRLLFTRHYTPYANELAARHILESISDLVEKNPADNGARH